MLRGTIWNALRVALRIISGKIIFNRAMPERLRTLRHCIFTGRVVEKNGSCSAAFCESAALGVRAVAERCSLLTPKENQKSASDFDALDPRKRGCSPLLTPKQRATPEKTEDSRLFGVKIF